MIKKTFHAWFESQKKIQRKLLLNSLIWAVEPKWFCWRISFIMGIYWPTDILDILLNLGYASGVNVSNTEWEMASRFHIPVKFSYIQSYANTLTTLGRGMNLFSLPNFRFVLNSRTDCILQPWLLTSLSKGQHWVQQLHHSTWKPQQQCLTRSVALDSPGKTLGVREWWT